MHRFRLRGIRISPALVISMLALFIALAGTGLASNIVPLARHALTADSAKTAKKAKLADTAKVAANSFKVGGQTADQIAQTPGPATDLDGQTSAQIAATPGPANSVPAGLFTIRSVGWSVQNEGNKTDARALCVTGEKAVAGGWDMANGIAYILADRPIPDGTGWFVKVYAASGNNVPANGSVWVICAKVS